MTRSWSKRAGNWIFGAKIRRGIESANDSYLASVANYDAVLVTLIGDVASTYVQIRTTQKQIGIAHANVKVQKALLDIAEARFEGVVVSERDAGCRSTSTAPPNPPPVVSVTRPIVREVREHLDLTGNTAPFYSVELVARIEGYLEKVHFTDGAQVKKGDLLFTIQQSQYRAQLPRCSSRA